MSDRCPFVTGFHTGVPHRLIADYSNAFKICIAAFTRSVLG